MIPALVQWELTGRCNYRCQHCYLIDESAAASQAELPDDDMWRIAETLVKHRLFFVTLTGGEPLIRGELVVELCRYFSENGVRPSLNTNLVLLNDNLLSRLKVRGVLVSCPSSIPEHYRAITRTGNYDRFEGVLRQVLSAGIGLTVNMVVNKLNLAEVRQTAIRMAELGVRKFAATPVSLNAGVPRYDLLLSLAEFQGVINDLIWAHEELGLHVDIMEALPRCAIPDRAFELDLPFIYRSCYAGRRNGTISPMGDVRPCGHNPNRFGNVLDTPLAEIWDGMQNWRQLVGNEHRNCLACDIQSSCDGGCMFGGHPKDPGRLTAEEYLIVSQQPARQRQPIELSEDTVVRSGRSFLSRPERDGWLVCSGSARDMITVNQGLYDFLVQMRDLPPLTLRELAGRFGADVNDPDFRRVVQLLVPKKYLVVQSAA